MTDHHLVQRCILRGVVFAHAPFCEVKVLEIGDVLFDRLLDVEALGSACPRGQSLQAGFEVLRQADRRGHVCSSIPLRYMYRKCTPVGPRAPAVALHFNGTVRSSSPCSSASTFCVGSCVEIIFIAAFVTSVAKSL